SLHYRGSLSDWNAALEGVRYDAPAGFHGKVVLNLAAQSTGASPILAQITITDGVFTIRTTADRGDGSLRQAILDADATPGAATIDFAIPGSGVQTILPGSPLPAITNAVLIDGTSQPGYAGAPLIELSGWAAGATNGLTITGSGAIVR